MSISDFLYRHIKQEIKASFYYKIETFSFLRHIYSSFVAYDKDDFRFEDGVCM